MSAKRLDDLAVFGGEPEFENPLHVGRPNPGDRERFLERVNAILDRAWLTNNGPFVRSFEERVAAIAGARHCVAFSNATLALELLIEALELRGEVIVPSFTFVATVHALQRRGITPVFCDIDPATFCIDPEVVRARITPRTSAILGVHCWGHPCDIETLERIAFENRLKLIFDAAHAFGCSHHGRMIGSFGAAEVFSFHATKFVHSLEGGTVVTNDERLAKQLRLMKNFGFQSYDEVVTLGTNAKMNELSAAMGVTTLENLEQIVQANHRNYVRYQLEIKGLPGVRLFPHSGTERHNYQYVVLMIDERITGLDRDRILQILHAENVLARRYFFPGCHRMEPYRTRYPNAGLLLPETERLVSQVLIMPTGPNVEQEQISSIGGILRTVLGNVAEVRSRLREVALKMKTGNDAHKNTQNA
jgi:dTDP-4-amino-4,6-dideoxygalactose transaminase